MPVKVETQDGELTEKLSRTWWVPADGSHPHYAAAVLLEARGVPLRVDREKVILGEDNKEYVDVRASKSGLGTYDAVLDDPQVAAMLEALEYDGSGLDLQAEIRRLQTNLGRFEWPEYAVNQMIAAGLNNGIEHCMRRDNSYRGIAYHSSPSFDTSGLRRWSEDEASRSVRLRDEADSFLARVPGRVPLGGGVVTQVVSAAVDRVLLPVSVSPQPTS